MSECLDPRFEKMLYAYELGLLTDADRAELEAHLLECHHCFEKVRDFEAASMLIRGDAEVRESVLNDVAKPQTTPYLVRWFGSPLRALFSRRLVPATTLILVILIALILRPWQIEISPRQEAVAKGNQLAILHFTNVVDPEDPQRLGKIIANLLIADLSESEYVRVVSSQRISDILEFLRRKKGQIAGGDAAALAAQKADARWIVIGTILQVKPNLVLSSELVDVQSGTNIASQRLVGEPDETIFSIVDRLSAKIKRDLSLSPGADREQDRPVAMLSTGSPEAYFYYLEGLENVSRMYNREAIASFERALEYDSTFAMAYYYLARLRDNSLISRAIQYMDKAGQRERLYIKSYQAFVAGNTSEYVGLLKTIHEKYPDDKTPLFQLGINARERHRYEEAIAYFKQAVAIDPLYKDAYNQMAYAYNAAGDFDEALAAVNTYVSLAPDEANPYDSRGDLYAFNGRIQKALASYQKALEIKPDFYASRTKLGNMLLYLGKYERAAEAYGQLLESGDPEVRAGGYLDLASVPMYQGKFDTTLAALDRGMAVIRDELGGLDSAGYENIYRLKRAGIFVEKGDCRRALAEYDEAINILKRFHPGEVPSVLAGFVYPLALCGDLEAAAQIRQEIAAHHEKIAGAEFEHWFASGAFSLADGRAREAAELLEKAAALRPARTNFDIHLILAHAYFAAGQIGDAVSEFESTVNTYSSERLSDDINSVKLHYYLGLAYEESRWFDKAAEQYELFLAIWKDADPGLAAMRDAAERLARLRNRL